MTTAQKILLKQHPLSAAFPSMTDAEVEALAEDIKKHGQREPGVLFEGMVLDGWHRYLACSQIDVKFVSVDFDGDDPVSVALSRNLHRRHLTSTQRAEAIVACTNWRANGRPRKGCTGADLSVEGMAEIAEVSERTIQQAKKGHRAGLGEAMKQGKVSARRAAEIADLPRADREKAINEPRPPRQSKSADAAPNSELIDLQGKYADLLEKHADLGDTARALEDKLTSFEKTEPDEQQKEIQRLQKKVVKLEAEVEHQKRRANDMQAKNNELIREVKKLRARG